jgi:hypothetical protein
MAPAITKTSLPSGSYKVVSLSLDLTGKKLIDEVGTYDGLGLGG